MGLTMLESGQTPRINIEVPAQPDGSYTSEQLFADAKARSRYWLPHPPATNCPALRQFWRSLMTGITEYRQVSKIPGPVFLTVGAPALRSYDGPRLDGASRHSNSPNWSGASVRAVDCSSLGQIVASWVEPDIGRAGSHTDSDEFRSSVWIGLNGHAAYLDAALPQIGTMQRILKRTPAANWTKEHWVWFEWWAIYKGQIIPASLLPIYINLDVHPGDTVWCSVEWVPGGLVSSAPVVARMFVCVETTFGGSRRKTLILPFLYEPPTLDGVQVRPMGSVANWIAELPTNTDPAKPFLMPEFIDTTTHLNAPVQFEDCAAGVATAPGEPIVSERTLEIARQIDMVTGRYEDRGAIARVATPLWPRTSDSAFQIRVDGNPA